MIKHHGVKLALVIGTLPLFVAGQTVLSAEQTEPKCRREVEAAFERLKNSGRPYRRKTIYILDDADGDASPWESTHDIVPPDRIRETIDFPHGSAVTIWIGPRVWTNAGLGERTSPSGWHELEPQFAVVVDDLFSEFDPTSAILPESAFECLGDIEYEKDIYTGYRTKLPQTERHKLQWWQTILIDIRTKFPIYTMTSPKNQLDEARIIYHYSYPDALRIEPPEQ